jgi:hypothetical protein
MTQVNSLAPLDVNYGVLPLDMLRNILVRLPADELCRLRLVCRWWRSLTSDPLFARSHLSAGHQHIILFQCDDAARRHCEVRVVDLHAGTVVKRIPLSFTESFTGTKAQRDLLCVSTFWAGRAHVIDIATGTVVDDPGLATTDDDAVMMTTCLLGYVPSCRAYKVLRIQ